MQDSCLSQNAEKIQSAAGRKDTNKFHDALKAVYGPKSSGTIQLLITDRIPLLKDKDATLKRRAEHFDSVFELPINYQ